MFEHAYSGYLRHAYPYDELRPLSCDGVDTWGSYSLTLIDALDTLAVVGNHSEFRRVYALVAGGSDGGGGGNDTHGVHGGTCLNFGAISHMTSSL